MTYTDKFLLDKIRKCYSIILESNTEFEHSPSVSDISPSNDIINITPMIIRKWYDIFNKWYFSNKLFDSNKLYFETEYLPGEDFVASSYAERDNDSIIPTKIIFNKSVLLSEFDFMNTLLHEMIHIYDYMYHPEHFSYNNYKTYNSNGRLFNMFSSKLNKYGWEISSIHSKILTKNNEHKLMEYNSMESSILKLNDEIENIVDNTLSIFKEFIFDFSISYHTNAYDSMNETSYEKDVYIQSINKDLLVKISIGKYDLYDIINMFKYDYMLFNIKIDIDKNELLKYPNVEKILKSIIDNIIENKNSLDKIHDYINSIDDKLKEIYKKIIVNKIHFISKCIENTIDMINNSEQNIEEKLEEDVSKSPDDIHERARILYYNLSKHAYTKVRVIDDKKIEFCIA